MTNTTPLPPPVFELVQDLLAARSTLENVRLEAISLPGVDVRCIHKAAQQSLDAIDQALDLIKYSEGSP